MAKKTIDAELEPQATERQPAPVTYTPPQLTVERQGAKSEPYTRYFPQVRGGICEFCGVLDPNTPSEFQYKLCPHFRGLNLRCSYCDETKNPDEVVYHAVLNIHAHPLNPNTLIVVCNETKCTDAHLKRFQLAR